MKAFQYTAPQSLAAAQELVQDEGIFYAGGIDVLGEMKESISEPKTLVDVKSLRELRGVERGDKVWTLGANTTISELEEHPELGKAFPGIQHAAAEVGSKQIRNVATLGGNLAQHSRCWYYRQRDVYCLKKGGDTCYARNGDNRHHSLFSGNPCISPVVSNLAIALAALEATAVVQRGEDQVRMSIPELYARAWDNPTLHHSLDRTDLILKVEVPNNGKQSAYLQMSEKAQFDWALVSCSAAAKVDGNKISKAKVFLGAVAPVPYQAAAANKLLEGKALDEKVAGEAADLLLRNAQLLAANGYKLPIARALIVRTLMKLKA